MNYKLMYKKGTSPIVPFLNFKTTPAGLNNSLQIDKEIPSIENILGKFLWMGFSSDENEIEVRLENLIKQWSDKNGYTKEVDIVDWAYQLRNKTFDPLSFISLLQNFDPNFVKAEFDYNGVVQEYYSGGVTRQTVKKQVLL